LNKATKPASCIVGGRVFSSLQCIFHAQKFSASLLPKEDVVSNLVASFIIYQTVAYLRSDAILF